ncbi:hypothetical protein CAPTEDRAFT_228011 [Capitella teleta]|uniref:Cysteine protease n=1 Tax=Capitella teleta TaxID=283909 RepID=R7VBX9_CAPTE|nr:hypothetical protein CAPTEDRAFT_228011 [Capitella teleta]|eukprot:ELU16134.1 hypothetical protein CAPTEDRAFT_228011 [Capitella teleta]
MDALHSPSLLGRSVSQTDQPTSFMSDSWVRPDYYPSSDDDQPVQEPDDTDQSEKLKVKLLAAWNNMKHGFAVKTKTNFKYESPIILLGKCYCCSKSEKEDQRRQPNNSNILTTFDRFKRDFSSKIWFTYRKDFPKLYGSPLTSDVGWGCMLRTAQMIIAQALVMHYLGRDWTIHHTQQNRKETMLHRQIIRLFGDFPGNDSPFSIQALVRIGVDHGKRPGDWYGPASVAYVVRDAINQVPDFHPLLSQVCVYVAPDCTVYIQDVIDLCTQHWKAVVILVPVRLGGEALNPIYSQCVQSLLAHELCLGIIGGRPKHSLYFVGWQEEKLLYLDPHFCQDTVDTRFRDFPTSTYHCLSPRKLALQKMDPSCTLGFYIPTHAAFNRLVKDMQKLVTPPKDQGIYPLFVFQDGRSIDIEHSHIKPESNRFLRIRHLDKKGRLKEPSQDSEDFVFL